MASVAALALVLTAGPAAALEPPAVAAARCAAFYLGLADFGASHPRLLTPDPDLTDLARRFRAAAMRLAPDAAAVDAAIAAERPGMELLVRAYVLYADPPSMRLYERQSRSCGQLEADLPETGAPAR